MATVADTGEGAGSIGYVDQRHGQAGAKGSKAERTYR